MKLNRMRAGGHMIDFLFTLALFCVFAASSLLVVIIGANVYQSTVKHMEENFSANTSLTYVSAKIRQHDAQGAVYTATFDGTDALVLEQQVGEQVFQTWIYYHNGSLYELFTQQGNADSMTADEGQAIIPVSGFSIELVENGLIRIASTDESGTDIQQFISLRS